MKNPAHTPIHQVDLADKENVREFLSGQTPGRLYITDKRTGRLYQAGTGLDLYSLHDPYTGTHVSTNRHLPQTWAGPIGESVLHSVYWDGNDLLCQCGTPLIHRLVKNRRAWSQAVMDVTFT